VIVELPVVVEKPAPKPTVHKARKHVAKVQPPAPVVTPAPVVEPPAPAVIAPEPVKPVTVAPPAKKVAEPGLLERYWLWLLILGLIIAGMVAWGRKNKGDKR
jgi:hypothetical protein